MCETPPANDCFFCLAPAVLHISDMSFTPKKILVIEEKGDWLDLLKYITGRASYQVIEANSDFDSIREAIATRPDLILLNLKYLGTNAAEIFSKLRVDESTKDIPVIIEVPDGDEESLRQAFRAGAKQVLYKPFDLTDLPSILRQNLATPKTER